MLPIPAAGRPGPPNNDLTIVPKIRDENGLPK